MFDDKTERRNDIFLFSLHAIARMFEMTKIMTSNWRKKSWIFLLILFKVMSAYYFERTKETGKMKERLGNVVGSAGLLGVVV